MAQQQQPQQFSIDQAELEAELGRTRRRLDEWASSRQQTIVDTRNRHLQTMQDQTGKVQGLQVKQQQLDTVAQQVKQRIEREEHEASTLRATADTLLGERDTLHKQLASTKEQVKAQEAECARRESESTTAEEVARKKLGALHKALALYSSRLGLDFKQGQDELRLEFSQVDPRQPQRKFVIGVRVQPDNTYKVTECDPQVNGLPELLQALNTSNDFSAFVKGTRVLFAASCQ